MLCFKLLNARVRYWEVCINVGQTSVWLCPNVVLFVTWMVKSYTSSNITTHPATAKASAVYNSFLVLKDFLHPFQVVLSPFHTNFGLHSSNHLLHNSCMEITLRSEGLFCCQLDSVKGLRILACTRSRCLGRCWAEWGGEGALHVILQLWDCVCSSPLQYLLDLSWDFGCWTSNSMRGDTILLIDYCTSSA